MHHLTMQEQDTAPAMLTATDRHEQGIAQLPALLNYWLGRSGLSHEQMATIAGWGLGEPGMIDPSWISRARNGRQPRGASWKNTDALAAANEAIWLWQAQGPEAARAKLGPQSSWGIDEKWLDSADWLPVPEHPDQPLRFAELASVFAGHLQLPYLATALMSPSEARQASERLSQLLDAAIAKRGWGPREAIAQVLAAYPTKDPARQRRLQGLVVGTVQLNREELEAELHALAEMLCVIRGLTAGSYGPEELRAELLPGNHRPA
jgi:hypothetical protein